MATQQANAISAAQQVSALMGQFYNLLAAVRAFTDANTTDNYITVLNALPTFAWNADGSAARLIRRRTTLTRSRRRTSTWQPTTSSAACICSQIS